MEMPARRESTPPPVPESEPLKVVITDVSDVAESRAHDVARARMAEDAARQEGISGAIVKLIKHNWFQVYNERKEYERARSEIQAEGDMYAPDDEHIDGQAHEAAMSAIVERFTHDYDGMIDTERGETRAVLESTPEADQIRGNIHTLIDEFVNNRIDEEAFEAEKTRILNGITSASRDVVGAGDLYADNLLSVACNIKARVEHGESLAHLKDQIQIVIGRAKHGVKTEAQLSWADRTIDYIQRSKLGALVTNETVVASGLSLAYSLMRTGSEFVARSKIAGIASLGGTAVLSGALAGAREHRAITVERSQHARELAVGRVVRGDATRAKRRAELERTRYDTRKATDLVQGLETALYESTPEGEQAVKETMTPEQQTAAFDALAEIEARITLSNQRRADLVSYSNVQNVEKEQTALYLARARAKVALRELVASSGQALPNGATFDDYMKSLAWLKVDELTRGHEGMDQKDQLFANVRRNRTARQALKAVGTGLVIGTVMQEAMAFASGKTEGAVEHLVHKLTGHEGAVTGKQSVTALEGLRRWMTDDNPLLDRANEHTVSVGDVSVRLPHGVDLVPGEDTGTYILTRDGIPFVENVRLNPDGTLVEDSLKALQESGGAAVTSAHTVVEQEARSLDPAEYVKEKGLESMKAVKRLLWFDNDTPKPVFDKNEIKLWWGGIKNTGLDNQGNYVFDVKHMMPSGSYHGQESANVQELVKEGKLKLLLSLSKETQNSVVEVPIGPDFKAVIDPESEVGKMLFVAKEGHAVFNGQYAEVAEVMSSSEVGEQVRVLATHVGEGVPVIPGVGDVTREAITTTIDVPADYEPVLPPFIPIAPRRPLEPTIVPEAVSPYYGYGKLMTPEAAKKQREIFSETIRSNPDVNLDHRAEIKTYLDRQDKDHRKAVEKLANSIDEMDEECRAAICIPVAGHQEGDNIYRSLDNYRTQTANPHAYEIVLYVNQPDRDDGGTKVKADKTMGEIKRFMKDHPEISVRVMNETLPRESAVIGNIRKRLVDSVLVRHMKRGDSAKDLIIVSNDADNKGVAPEYVDNFIEKFDTNEKTDAFLGQLDWDPESYVRNPLIHIGTRLFQYVDTQSRAKGWHVGSSGANYAFRSSIYAAVNGYESKSSLGEDTTLGERFKLSRAGAKEHTAAAYAGPRASRIYTSSRRAEKVLKEGRVPLEQWDGAFSAFDDEVRKVKWEEGTAVNLDDPKDVEKLTKNLETVINGTIKRMGEWGLTTKEQVLSRSLHWLGIRYEVLGPHEIKFTDVSRLIQGLKEYETHGLAVWKKRTQTSKK